MKIINQKLLIALGLTLSLSVGANTVGQIEPVVADQAKVSVDSQKPTQEEKEDSSVHNFPLASEVAGTNLEKQRDKWLKGDKVRAKKKLGFDKKGSYIGWAVSAIEANPKQTDFGQKRIMAFEKAYSDAKAKFVQTKRQKVVVDTIRKFFHNDDMSKDVELKDGKLIGISKKIAALTEAKLDRALREMGVDPKDVENSDISSKRVLAENSLSKTITISAIESVPGIRILATFEDINGVGVLIKHNRNYSNLATAISTGRMVDYPTKTNPVEDITDQLNNTFVEDVDYISNYGVRIMVDEAGNRVLVSFGQWSPKVTKSDSQFTVNMGVQAAQRHAYNLALSYITQFVRTTLSLKDMSKLNDADKKDIIERTAGATTEQEKHEVGAFINNLVTENSSWTPEGVAEAITWTTNHPETGHLIVGKVLMWSPMTQEYAKQGSKLEVQKAIKKKKEKKIESKVRTSIDLGDDDF
jgi:hypothetical protein